MTSSETTFNDEELIAMARLAQRDDRMSTGALYGNLSDRIEALRAALDEAEARAVKAEAERDAANALLRETRGIYQVTHIHAAIDAHLGAKP